LGKINYLWDLQCIDTREKSLRRELRNLGIKKEITELESRLGQKRREFMELSRRLQEGERAIRKKEGEAGENERKQLELEKRLYSGQTSSARELSQIQRKIATLKEKGKELEEKILALMLEQEALEKEQEKLTVVLRELEAELDKKQVVYAREAGELEQELELLPAEREKLLPMVEEKWLDLYQRLSVINKGQAVAAVRGDLCLGCRISLPTNLVSQIITNERLQTCPNCGRILYYQGTK
jgi:predicted  nucleic acid-binding Zn-ribbon protein